MKTVALKLLSSVSHCGTEELSGLVWHSGSARMIRIILV